MSTDSRYVLAARLAQFLRRNGDKVINGSCKLSLTTSALCLLNSLFIEILSQDFHNQLEVSDSSFYGIHEDVQYLYDFMKRTSSLKLFHGMQTLRGGVDLSHFSNLTFLELRKIPAHLIIGLNSLSIQLKALICSRSIYLLKELFGSSDDEQTLDVWAELKEINLSYNYLESLDDSIKCLPNIEVLDLNHNNIKNTETIQVLNQLRFVNLSYNQLETLPMFSSLSCRHMCKLYVRNNNLESLDGLECLFNLEEFDVGYNLLSEYSVLSPLDKLKSLKMLNLEGNPLFFHRQHFQLVCTFIHPFTLNQGLRLNGKLIAIPQKLLPTASDPDAASSASRHQTSINTVVGDMQNVIHPPEITPRMLKAMSPLASASFDRNSVDEVSASSYTSQNDMEQLIADAKLDKKQRKKSKSKKMREAQICEPEVMYNERTLVVVNNTEEIPSHIKAKHAFETRRKERGESWLIPDDPFKKFISPPNVPSNTPIFSSDIVETFPKDFSEKLQTCLESQTPNEENVAASPIESELTEVVEMHNENASDTELERKRHFSKESDDIEILASNLQVSPTDAEIKMLSSEDLSDSDFYDSLGLQYSEDVADDVLEMESDEESEDSIFFIEKIVNLNRQLLSVHIGPQYAKEKDAITGKVLDKIDLSSLSSVDIAIQEKDEAKYYKLHLEFDTVKSSRQQRVYVSEDSDSIQRMSKILQPFADASTLKEATIGALECLKCKSQFSKQVAHRKVLKTKKPFMGKEVMASSYDSSKGYIQEANVCPNCGNDILVEMDSIPLPSIATPPRLIEDKVNASKKSSEIGPDNSSVGSSSSGNLFANLFSSIKISPMLKRKSTVMPFNDSLGEDSFRSVDTFGTYDSEKEISSHRESEPQLRRNSSDVTIISNPSQSSIAVIPDPGIENNLNTIVERDSQSSLSPPISGSSTVLSNFLENKIITNSNLGKLNGTAVDDCARPSTIDQDFYSLTESFEGEREKPFKCSDIISSDSDVFHSPYKSAGSSQLEPSKKIEQDECSKLMQILGDKENVTYNSFTHLDHRLKLYVEMIVFGNDECLTACLETSIVPLSTGEEFGGLFALSSKNVYIFKFLTSYYEALEQSEPLTKHAPVLYSGPLNQVKQIKTMLGSQGISIACGPASQVYTLVIRDVDTCNSFCNLVSEQILEKNPQFECLTSAKETLQYLCVSVLAPLDEVEESPEILFHQFAFQRELDVVQPVCITLTPDDIFLSKILYKKQQSCSDLAKAHFYRYSNIDQQKVSDIISLKLGENFTSVEVCFMIESSEIDSVFWTIEMQTKSAMFSFVSALKSPWEELFAVTLPLSMTETNS